MATTGRNLTCPACGKTLTEKQVGEISVDVCENGCAGIWFDRYEIKKFDEQHENIGDLTNISKDPNVIVDKTKKRICPTCNPQVPMQKHFWSVKSEVQVDECYTCGGFWLDDGELEKIRSLYKNEAEKDADAAVYFRQLSNKLIDNIEIANEKKQKKQWYDKLAYAIFGI